MLRRCCSCSISGLRGSGGGEEWVVLGWGASVCLYEYCGWERGVEGLWRQSWDGFCRWGSGCCLAGFCVPVIPGGRTHGLLGMTGRGGSWHAVFMFACTGGFFCRCSGVGWDGSWAFRLADGFAFRVESLVRWGCSCTILRLPNNSPSKHSFSPPPQPKAFVVVDMLKT